MRQASEFISPDFYVSFEELCVSADVSTDKIIDLIDYSVITPVRGKLPQEWQFNFTAVRIVNKAIRLQRDLEIDWADIGLILTLLNNIDQLRSENAILKQQLKRFSKSND